MASKMLHRLVVLLALCFLVCLLVDMVEGQEEATTRRPRRNGRERGTRRNRNRNREANGGAEREGRRNRGEGRRDRGNRQGSRPRGNRVGVEDINVPMCKGLVPYTKTKLPNRFNHTTQLQVYRQLEHMWHYMDHGCSKNTRLMICSMYLPKWVRKGAPQGPCKSLCMKAKQKCAEPLQDMFRLEWDDKFNCDELPARKCLKPLAMNAKKRLDPPCPDPYPYPSCNANSVMPVCQNISFSLGTFPNMFEQCHVGDINKEIEWFALLQATNCHIGLNFLLCGVYAPFCVNDEPFVFPCGELCIEVRTACEPHYRRLYGNLPWPNKLQCHRFPLATMSDRTCVMPDEGALYRAGADDTGTDTA